VALRVPVPTALTLVGRMIVTTFKTVDHSITDGVGEIVTIIAGQLLSAVYGATVVINLSPPENIDDAHDHFMAAVVQNPNRYAKLAGIRSELSSRQRGVHYRAGRTFVCRLRHSP
jgi:hypothetical protein